MLCIVLHVKPCKGCVWRGVLINELRDSFNCIVYLTGRTCVSEAGRSEDHCVGNTIRGIFLEVLSPDLRVYQLHVALCDADHADAAQSISRQAGQVP